MAAYVGADRVDRHTRRARDADLELEAVAQPEPCSELRERSAALLDIDRQSAFTLVNGDRQRLRAAAVRLRDDRDLVTIDSAQLDVTRDVVDRQRACVTNPVADLARVRVALLVVIHCSVPPGCVEPSATSACGAAAGCSPRSAAA